MINRKLRVGLDLDGVVYNFDQSFKSIAKEQFEVEIGESIYWNYIKDQISQKQWDLMWTRGITRWGLFRDGDLYPGARHAIDQLAQIADLVVISSRPKLAHKHTLAWLAQHEIPTSEIHLVEGMSKASIPCDLYIDDSADNAGDILGCTEASMLLWDRPWNQGFEDTWESPRLHRVSTWAEVYQETYYVAFQLTLEEAKRERVRS